MDQFWLVVNINIDFEILWVKFGKYRDLPSSSNIGFTIFLVWKNVKIIKVSFSGYCAFVLTCIVLYWIFSKNLHSSESHERYFDFVQKTGVVTSQIKNVPFLDFFLDDFSPFYFTFEMSWHWQRNSNMILNGLHEWTCYVIISWVKFWKC